MEKPNLLVTLRHTTRGQQHALRQTLGYSGLPASTEAGIERLSRFRSVYAPLEIQLAAFGVWEGYGLAPAGPYGLEQLDTDLKAIGVREPAFIRDCPSVPRLKADHATAFGYLYVMHAVSLDAQTIARRLKQARGVDAGNGALREDDADGQEIWRSFDAALQRLEATGAERDKVVFGAIYAFNVFLNCCEAAAQTS